MKKSFIVWIIAVLLASLFLISAVSASSDWYDSDWSHRKQWTLTNVSNTTLTNYPAYVNVIDEPEMQADWDDVVFTDSASNLIPYELESYTASYADYWINVTIPASSVSGWMYYGNDGASSQENPEGVYDSYTMVVHRMQDLNDSTSNNNDATNHGATYNSSGRIDGAYDFNGSESDYWDCGNDTTLSITGPITIEADVCPLLVGTKMRIVFGSNQYTLWIRADNVFRFADTKGNHIITTMTASTNTWYHLVAVFSGHTGDVLDSSNIYLYVDGIQKGTSIAGTWNATSLEYVYFGKKADISYLNGTVDNVIISSTARSADWVNQSYEMVMNQSTWVSWGGVEKNHMYYLGLFLTIFGLAICFFLYGTLDTNAWMYTNILSTFLGGITFFIAGFMSYCGIYSSGEVYQYGEVGLLFVIFGVIAVLYGFLQVVKVGMDEFGVGEKDEDRDENYEYI